MGQDGTVYDVSNRGAAASSAMVQNPGELWPGWETVRIIGKGSFGAVYEIRREIMGLKETAALKKITIPGKEDEISSLRSDGMDEQSITSYFQECVQDILKEYGFMKEVRGHTNIVNCDDFRAVRHSDGIGWDIYIKMELLTALPGIVEQEPLSEKQVIRMGKDICRALMVCKSKNIVHRDIKPQNIFVSADGDYKLGDFGVSMISDHTTFASTAGTYRYMAPEVYFNKPYGFKSDLYSLGLVMYWLLNHRRGPFEPLPPKPITKSALEKAKESRFLGEKLPNPAMGSKGLHGVIRKACAFEADDRYQSAEEMLQALEALEGKAVRIEAVHSEAVEEKEERPEKKRKFGAIVCGALAVAGLIFALTRFSAPGPEIPDPEQTTADMQTEQTGVPGQLEYDPDVHYRITLTPNDQMGVMDYQDAIALLRQRLDILTAGEEYSLQDESSGATLLLPRESVGSMNVEDLLRQYITRPIDLYLVDVESADGFGMNLNKVSLAREDMAEICMKDGPVTGIDLSAYGIEETQMPYLEIRLTDAFIQRCGEDVAGWNKIGLAQDIANDQWWYTDAVYVAEEGLLYLFCEETEQRFYDLLLFNLQHDPLPEGFYFSVENTVEWEVTETAFKKGQYQVDVDSLAGKTVTVYYRSWSIPERESGDWIDAYVAVKKMLDALELPYAIGWTCKDGSYGLVFRTGVDRMCPAFMEMMIKSSGVSIRCGMKEDTFYLTDGGRIIAEKDGSYRYELDVQSDYDGAAALAALTQDVSAQKHVTLNIAGIPVFSASPEAPITDGVISFDDCYFDTDEDAALLHFLDVLIHNPGVSMMSLDYYAFEPDEHGETATEEDFGILHRNQIQARAVREVVRKYVPDATVREESSNSIYVFLNLYVDESLPATAAETVKKIYQDLDFEAMQCDCLAFILIDENDEEQERARIFFRKSFYEEKITVNGIFRNGRLDKYREQFLNLLEKDLFFADKATFEEGSW